MMEFIFMYLKSEHDEMLDASVIAKRKLVLMSADVEKCI